MNKLFQTFAGVIPVGTSMYGGTNVTSDTPFLAMGLWHDSNTGGTPYLLCMVQGGKILSVKAEYVRVELTDDMKKALAEVVLTS
jgi:hypothetical protein